jgi:CheY-like chemotaxis protein
MTWFLIDDDPDDQEIFLLTLEKVNMPIDCVVVKDGIEALRKLKDGAFTPDCIMLDLNMPIIDGRQCLSEIKKIERLNAIPVYIYSTSSESTLKKELKQQGATGYIEKPSSISDLGEIMKKLYADVEKGIEG